MAKDKFMFFQNFKETADKLPPELRLKFYDAITDYVFYEKESDDPVISALVNAFRPSLTKEDGRKNNGGNHNPKGVNQYTKSGQSLVNSGQSRSIPLETETETETEINIHTSTSGGGLPPTEEIISGWNSVARKYHLSTIKTLDERRLRSFRQRYEQSGVSNLAEFFALIDGFLNDSLFLQGKRMCKDGNDWVTQDTDWRADFDFFLQRKSFTKALEGGYDDPTVRKFKEATHATTEK